jgi:hypothetical protein
MYSRAFTLILASWVLAAGCRNDSRQPSDSVPRHKPQAGFESPERLEALIAQRWPLWAIRTFCIPERRSAPEWQNLVQNDQPIWRGKLYEDAKDFDEIEWHANTENGRAVIYSLNARRGKDHWILEVCHENDVQQPAHYAPDPSDQRFVGHDLIDQYPDEIP